MAWNEFNHHLYKFKLKQSVIYTKIIKLPSQLHPFIKNVIISTGQIEIYSSQNCSSFAHLHSRTPATERDQIKLEH